MSNKGWTIFVEGGSDKKFIGDLLQFENIKNVEVAVLGGGVSKIEDAANEIRKKIDAGNRIATILDADDDYEERSSDLKKVIKKLNLPIKCHFFIPNNKDSGAIETLLEQMAALDHQGVYSCLDKYSKCLKTLNKLYNEPDTKTRIYEYCRVVGIKAKPAERNYECQSFWNLNVPVLKPLKEFLKSLHEPD